MSQLVRAPSPTPDRVRSESASAAASDDRSSRKQAIVARALGVDAQEAALTPRENTAAEARRRFRSELLVQSRERDTSWMNALPASFLKDVEREYSLVGSGKLSDKDKRALEQKVEAHFKADPAARELSKAEHKKLVDDAYEALLAVEQTKNVLSASFEVISGTSMSGKDSRGKARESLVALPPGGVRRIDGAHLARLNFMGTMAGIFGGDAAVKDHFSAIKPSKAPGGPLLHAGARAALDDASSTFVTRYPGYRFAATGTAFQLRNRHHERHSAGMLGHVLGIALDYQAHDNPHLTDAQGRALIEMVGGGPSRLVFEDDKGRELDFRARRRAIQRLGEETRRAGGAIPFEARSAASQALLGQLDGAYDAMMRTSRALRASLGQEVEGLGGDPVAVLRQAGERYWASRAAIRAQKKKADDARGHVASARKKARQDLERERARAAKRARTAPEPVSDGEVDQAPAVARALAAQNEAESRYEALTAEIAGLARKVLAPWRRQLQARIDQAAAAVEGAGSAAAEAPLEQVRSAYKAVQRAGHDDKRLRAVLADPAHAALFAGLPEGLAGKALAAAALARLNQLGAIAVDRALLERLDNDLDFVLGASAATVKDPAVLQLVERGFLRDDAMEAPPAASASAEETGTDKGSDKTRKPVFNREFVHVMMEHGFEPAAAWVSADSMHFDHVASFAVFAGKEGKLFGATGVSDTK